MNSYTLGIGQELRVGSNGVKIEITATYLENTKNNKCEVNHYCIHYVCKYVIVCACDGHLLNK